MGGRRLASLLLLLGACTSTEPSDASAVAIPPPPPVVREEPPEPEPSAPEVKLPASELPWSWFHSVPDRIAGGLIDAGTAPAAFVPLVGSPRRYVAWIDDEGLHLRREDLDDGSSAEVENVAWSRSLLAKPFGEPIVLADLRDGSVVVGYRRSLAPGRTPCAGHGTPVRYGAARGLGSANS